MLQKDQCTLADYYNSKEKLVYLLENLELKRELSTTSSQALPNYSNLLNLNPTEIVVIPRQQTTRSQARATAEASKSDLISENLLKKHQSFLQSLTKSVKQRFSDQTIPQHNEIRAAAILFNDLCDSFIDDQDKLIFCGVCGGMFTSGFLPKHHRKNHQGMSLTEQSFTLTDFKTEKGPPMFHDLKNVLKSDVTDEVLHKEYAILKEMFKVAEKEVVEKMYIYHSAQY